MKIVLVLAAITALCAGVPTPVELPEAPTPVKVVEALDDAEAPTPVKVVEALEDAEAPTPVEVVEGPTPVKVAEPTIPRGQVEIHENVEGARHRWMPDANGQMHYVDLHYKPTEEELEEITRNANNNQYRLFTRSNPTSAQIITNGNAGSITASNYLGSRALVVIIHGWQNNGNADVNIMIRDAFLAVQDVNVIVVDWSHTSQGLYGPAVTAVPAVGQHVGNFVTWLINTAGGNWNNVHFVGHSLGAHAVGNAGRTVGNRARRVTGLDPAGPSWNSNNNALRASDGVYVECIHTDGKIAGIFDPICQANFYPNGGQNCQPGCNCNPACSHGRAYEFFAATVRYNHLVGRKCNNIFDANTGSCSGASVPMGTGILNKDADGLYALRTGSSWPF